MHLSSFGTRLLRIALITMSVETVTLLNSTASAADNDLTDPTSVARAFPPKSPDTPMANFPAKKAPYKIAFSNSYFGNNWRAEMLKAADAYAKQPQVRSYIKEYKVYNAGNDVGQQIAQIRQIILSGADAIVVNAASPTGLDSVQVVTVKRCIAVVAFDNTVGTNKD